jgi:LysR family glycine cleavage system transcriptional activator
MSFDDAAPDWRMWLAAAGVEGVDTDRGMRFSQFDLAIQAAIDGAGVVLGFRSLVADDLAAGRLVIPFDLSLPLSFAYYVVAPEATADRPKVVAFRDWLLAEAAVQYSNAST